VNISHEDLDIQLTIVCGEHISWRSRYLAYNCMWWTYLIKI